MCFAVAHRDMNALGGPFNKRRGPFRCNWGAHGVRIKRAECGPEPTVQVSARQCRFDVDRGNCMLNTCQAAFDFIPSTGRHWVRRASNILNCRQRQKTINGLWIARWRGNFILVERAREATRTAFERCAKAYAFWDNAAV